ncbi:hypothetical protein Amn_pc01200 (plasmid) [Aminobacter sp. Y103A]|nr:hypothetical protein Amn_pc01200 [Aminobacter sp. SS-2016]
MPAKGLRMFDRVLPFSRGWLYCWVASARSDDGIIIPRSLDARRLFDKEPPRLQQPQNETSVFPVATGAGEALST